MDQDTLRVLITVVLLVAFLGIVWWAYGRSRRARFDEAANLPFAEGDEAMQRRTIEAERGREGVDGRREGGATDERTERGRVSREES